MKRLIKWLLLFTTVVVISLTVILFNPQLVKSPIEYVLTQQSGYVISLDGTLDLSLGKTTSIHATNLRISNPAYKEQPDLADIGSLKLSIESQSIWSNSIVFSEIRMDDTQVTLDTNESSVSNWETPSETTPKEKPAEAGKTFYIKAIEVKNSSIHYQQHAVGKNQLLKITRLVQTEAQDGLLNIALDATFNDRPTTFNGHIGTFANIIKGRDVSFDGKGQLGPIKISGKGLIDDLIHPKKPTFAITMNGPNIKDVTAMLKIDDLGHGPFDLEAHGQESNGKYSAKLEGKIGSVNLSANALSHQAGNFNKMDVKLGASGPNLGALARAFGKKDWPNQSFSLHGDIRRNNGDLNISQLKMDIGGANFLLNARLTNFPRLDPSELTLSIKGDEVAHFRKLLGIKGVATGPFSLEGDLGLSDDNVRQLTLDFASALGTAAVSGSLGAAPSYSGTKLHVKALGHNAHQFMSIFKLDMLPPEAFTFESDLQFKDSGKNNIRHFTLNQLKIELADVSLVGSVAFDAQNPLTTGNGSLHLSSQDIANLKRFSFLEQPMALIVPGQPFDLKGDLSLRNRNWELKNLKGSVGRSSLKVNGVLKPAQKWANSNLQFNLDGPGLQLLFNNISASSHLQEAFTSSGQLQVSKDKLQLNTFAFESGNAKANINGAMAWPVVAEGDMTFNVQSQGSDISRFVPKIGKLQPADIAFNLTTSGTRRDNKVYFEKLTATAGSLRLTLSGNVDKNIHEQATANIQLASDNISDLGRYDGQTLPGAKLMVKAGIHGSVDHFKLSNLQASLDNNDLSGSLEVFLDAPKPAFILDSSSQLLDFRSLQTGVDPASKATTDTQRSEKDEKRPDRLIPETPLPLAALAQYDATINASVKQLMFKSDSVRNINLKASVKNGVLDIPALSFNGLRGNVETSLTMTPTAAGQAKVNIDLRTGGFVFSSHGHGSKVPAMDLILKAHGQGSNLRQLAGTATGTLKAGSHGGTLAGVNLGFLDNFVLDQIFSLILPKSKQHENTKLTCAAAAFTLENGVAETDPAFAFTTNKITLISKGTLDLSTERLSFGFKATPNNVLKVSAGELLNSFIVVGGTLSKPEVGLDPTKVLIQGGAAIGTAGISLLAKGLFDHFGSTVPVCQSMLEELKQSAKGSD